MPNQLLDDHSFETPKEDLVEKPDPLSLQKKAISSLKIYSFLFCLSYCLSFVCIRMYCTIRIFDKEISPNRNDTPFSDTFADIISIGMIYLHLFLILGFIFIPYIIKSLRIFLITRIKHDYQIFQNNPDKYYLLVPTLLFAFIIILTISSIWMVLNFIGLIVAIIFALFWLSIQNIFGITLATPTYYPDLVCFTMAIGSFLMMYFVLKKQIKNSSIQDSSEINKFNF